MIRILAQFSFFLVITYGAFAEEGVQLWSLVPRGNPQPPVVENKAWPQRPLDHFILRKIEAADQTPTPRAERRALVRRAYLDLHGLPPTTAQLNAFVLDNRPNAWTRLIDELLASPRYGERWGRHWLDIARYADSNGMDEDIAHPQAYRYRDYVVAAFNNDRPFDQFIIEQIAGDLIPAENEEEQMAKTVGVGFLSVGPKMLACDDPDKMRRDIVDEQLDTTGRAFLGLTFGCARCHDHKFDPISIEDYYGLAGIFMSTKTLTKYSVVAKFHQHDFSEPEHKERRAKVAKLEKLKGDEKKAKQAEIDELKKGLPAPVQIMGPTEYPAEDIKVHLRGDYMTLGEVVPRRIPVTIAAGKEIPMPRDQSGRLQLAQWIATTDNPLTARVIANRIWRWHFGRGIVPTPDNFGVLGVPPTHPELLDHLAQKLIDSGWSIKALHREMMNSATYQQSTFSPQSLKDTDPENELFARWKPRRLESEALRDSILFKSNRIDLTMGGSMVAVRSNKYVDRGKLDEHAKSTRRTIYLPVLRSSGFDGQNAFDFADPSMICGHRRSSTVATQALYLMNSPQMHQSSEALAEILIGATPDASPSHRAAWLVLHILGREATPEEKARAEKFAADYAPGNVQNTWAAFARALFSSNEFLHIE